MTTTAAISYKDSDTNQTSYELVPEPDDLVSDEADDLMIALLATNRLRRETGEGLTLEDSMRSLGLDPVDFGLE